MSNAFTIDEIVSKYLALREEIETINATTKSKLEPLKKAMGVIESYLLDLSNKSGQTNFGTAKGTAFQTTENHCGILDWDQTLEYIRTNNAWHFLNKAINKTAVGEHVEQNGAPPPGVKWSAIKVIQVRKK